VSGEQQAVSKKYKAERQEAKENSEDWLTEVLGAYRSLLTAY
jgi:hypothetical protein